MRSESPLPPEKNTFLFGIFKNLLNIKCKHVRAARQNNPKIIDNNRYAFGIAAAARKKKTFLFGISIKMLNIKNNQ